MHRLVITIEARHPRHLLQAVKVATGVITGWLVDRCSNDLNQRRRGLGWLVRIEDRSLEVELERSTAKGGKLRIVE